MRSAFRQSTKVPFPFPTPHSCRSRRGSPKPYLDKHIPRTSVDSPSSQVRRSEAWKRTIQPQAATSFALIPDWLRFAHFLASSRRKAGSAGRKRPGTVGLSRAFPRGSRSPVLCIPDQGCSIAHHETQGTEVLPELSALADEVGRPRGACEGARGHRRSSPG